MMKKNCVYYIFGLNSLDRTEHSLQLRVQGELQKCKQLIIKYLK